MTLRPVSFIAFAIDKLDGASEALEDEDPEDNFEELYGFQVSQDWDFVLVDFQHLNNYSGTPAGSRVHACMYWGEAQKLLGCTVEVSCLLAPAIATC